MVSWILVISLFVFFTLIGALVQLCEAAILSANFSRVKELEEDGNKQACQLSALRTTQKAVFYVTVRVVLNACGFGVMGLSFKMFLPALKAAMLQWNWLSDVAASWLALVCVALAAVGWYVINAHIIPRKIGVYRCESIAYPAAGVQVGC